MFYREIICILFINNKYTYVKQIFHTEQRMLHGYIKAPWFPDGNNIRWLEGNFSRNNKVFLIFLNHSAATIFYFINIVVRLFAGHKKNSIKQHAMRHLFVVGSTGSINVLIKTMKNS